VGVGSRVLRLSDSRELLSIEQFDSFLRCLSLTGATTTPTLPTQTNFSSRDGRADHWSAEHHEGLTKLHQPWLAIGFSGPPEPLSALDCYEASSVDAASDPLTYRCRTSIGDSPSGCSEELG
jgi:hypothetical protein